MPALSTTITADARPFERELNRARQLSAQAGQAMARNLSMEGAGHGGQAGILRESLVVMRELASGRGLNPRTAGSITILLQKLGLLKFLMTDSASAAATLAAAWEAQSVAASAAAVATAKKAQASAAAFLADSEATEAELAQAIADEQGAVAAMANAAATREKAIAAREAAAATESSTGAAISSLGKLGIAAAIVAAAIYAIYKLYSYMADKLQGLKVPDFDPDYIPKWEQAINQATEAQKEINREIERTIELYNSAAEAAKRVADATREHFEHLRKMNSFEKDPRKRRERELEINRQERDAEIKNKDVEAFNLEQESRRKKAEADAIKVSSKKADEENIKEKKRLADEAKKQIEGDGGEHPWEKRIWSKQQEADFEKARNERAAEAAQRKKDYQDAVDSGASNDELRKKRDALDKESEKAATAAAKLRADQAHSAAVAMQKNQDEREEVDAANAADIGHGRNQHGHVSDLQKIGAFIAEGTQDVARQSLKHLASIDHKMKPHSDKGRDGRTHGTQF